MSGSGDKSSEETCEVLGSKWLQGKSIGYPSTCAASKFNKDTECEKMANGEEAADECNALGARLCSLEEVQAGATKSTGCGFDNKLIWTADGCGTDKIKYRMVFAGNPKKSYTLGGAQCSEDLGGANIALRCCADALDTKHLHFAKVTAGDILTTGTHFWVIEIKAMDVDRGTDFFIGVANEDDDGDMIR
jgi:hypothetical protein